MTKATRYRTAALAALIVMTMVARPTAVTAADPAEKMAVPTVQIHGDQSAQFIPLGVGKGLVVDLPGDIKDVLVADPTIANAVVRTSRRAYIIGVKIGQTNIYFFDAAGRQLMAFDIAVKRDLNGIRAAIKHLLPDCDIAIEAMGDGVVLSGSVASPLEAQQAYDLAGRLVGPGDKVANAISVRGRDQVMLKVTVAEVQRDIIKQLGIDLSANLSSGQAMLNFQNTNPFAVAGGALVSSNAATLTYKGVTSTLRAMERAGIIRTLAEPNLTAISGETANFLAGGEFPIPAGFTCDPTSHNCQTQIQFKKFGVGLNFTPVVMSEGRISLKVLTEVSELSNDNALTLTQSVSLTQPAQTLTVPSIKTRRAETTVEIPSGGTLAMAGMIQEQTKQQLSGMPGLMNLPVLGALFKSRDYQNHQTELVVMVTPYIVRAVAQKDLSRPDDGYADASDASTTLLGRFNRLYGTPGKDDPRQGYRGNVGFFLD